MFIVGDLEADGLLSQAHTIWCGSFYTIQDEEWYTFDNNYSYTYQLDIADWLVSRLERGDYLVCHNAIGYDVPLIKKLTGIQIPINKVIDTLLLSKMFFPDIKGHGRPHSLDAWGERFGIAKPEHEDWTQYSPEMLHRNIEDVKINTKLFQHIQKQGFNIK